MICVFDTSSFVVLENFYPDHFASFWKDFDAFAKSGQLVSVSEVLKELDRKNTRQFVLDWVNARAELFQVPSAAEGAFVRGIFAVPVFQALVKQKNRLQGTPVADPWVIARAAVAGGCVVTEESPIPGKVRIPGVCAHFKVASKDIEGLMRDKGWKY
jgi:hypothetical protein